MDNYIDRQETAAKMFRKAFGYKFYTFWSFKMFATIVTKKGCR